MKKIACGVCTLFILIAFMACGGSDDDESSSEPAVQELQVGQTASGFIEKEGDVDTFHLRANEANKFLYIHCSEATSGSNVDLLVTVFGENNGQRTRLFGKHKPDGATLSADLDLWVFIDEPKDLYITVRDFMDDDASPDIAYQLIATFQDSANGNHDFSNAQSVGVDAAQPTSDAISEIGEVDCFTFTPSSDGVYSVNIDHQKPTGGSPVQLAITLYDQNGNRIQRLEDPAHTVLVYLEAAGGPYFVIVEDNDSRNADEGAPYALSVDTVSVGEAQANDDVATPTVITPDAADTYTAVGAIDYGCSSLSPDHAADLDWYSFTIGSGGSDYHQLELTIDDGATVEGTSPLRVMVYNSEMKSVTSYDFSPGGEAYHNNIRIQDGEYFISVAPANSKLLSRSTTYQVQLSVASSIDTYETIDENKQDTARVLADGVPINDGYVSYPADVDWYGINVNTSNANILSVDFTAAATSIVDYQVSIWLGDTMIKKVTDADGSDIATHLKTSILIPAQNPAGNPTYHIKVCDAQNNEGSNVAYTLRADIDAVPTASPGPIPETSGSRLYYYGETGQEAEETEEVELEIFSTLQPTFKANTSYLDFRNNDDIVQTSTGPNTTEITFPWITGYADYQGDRDFFRIEFDKLDPNGPDTTWYYDVEVRLVVPAGSDVEYVWKLYRDSNGNKKIQEHPESEDGYKACAGDTAPESTDAIDQLTPDGTDPFWIGSQWGGGNTFFYFGISDFNYLQLPSGGAYTEPDDDWGYDQPYYFQLKLIYHNDRSCPTCNAGQ